MKAVAIIPARYGSTRFPGKPLAMIGDKPMIQHVYEQVAQVKALNEIWVATDDERIMDAVAAFGGCAAMTSPHHTCGTDRCAEVARNLHLDMMDIVINVQGDMPMIKSSSIMQLYHVLIAKADLATLITTCPKEEYKNPNCVKVALNHQVAFAFKFSRHRINGFVNHKHIGVYGYTAGVLDMLSTIGAPMPKSNLEQVRWLNDGFSIYCKYVLDDGISVDTPEDLVRVEAMHKR